MVALKPAEVARFLKKRPAGIAVILLYGPDQGLVRDRAVAIGHTVVEDLNDPFSAVQFLEAELTEPGALLDEARALSFVGGERLIRVRGGGEPVAKAAALLLGAAKDGETLNGITVIEAGELRKTAKLRKLCEGHAHGASIACYPEEGAALTETVRQLLSAENLTIEDDALAAFLARAGDDRGLVRGEIEKLILYKGPASLRSEPATVSYDDLREALAENINDATFEVVDDTLSGQTHRLSEALYRARGAGVSPLGMLRILQGKLARLLSVHEKMEQGMPRAAAIKSLRPPVFYAEQQRFGRQVDLWSQKSLEWAAREALETDLAAKSTGMPQTELVERLLLRLAMRAARAG